MKNKEILDKLKERAVQRYLEEFVWRWRSLSVREEVENVLRDEKENYLRLTEELKDKVVITELGKSTVVSEIPELDFETLTIGGNEKYIRLGCIFVYHIQGSSPMELAIDRVLERVRRLDNRMTIAETDEEDDYGEPYCTMVHDNDLDGEYYPQDNLNILVDKVEKGKSMVNLNKPHYAWTYFSSLGRFISIDEETFRILKGIGLVERECIGCGSKILGGKTVCPLCMHEFEECSDCGKEVRVSDGKVLGNRFVCNECASLPRCRGCGYPLRDTEGVLCERCSGIRGILEYHSGLGRKDESDGYRYRVGVEVEKEDDFWVHNTKTREVLERTGWIIERDGSLNRDIGFEMISPIYPLDVTEINARIEPISKLLGAKTTARCGGHIHVSDTERTPYEILLDIRGYLPLLYGLYPDRATNEYCEAKEVDSYLERGHRQAINITDKTLEFRIFPAVKNKEQLLFRLELVEYMIKNKETDVLKVGELLLDKDSELYKILNKRISDERLKIKAQAFVDYTNYIDRDALVYTENKIERVIKVPKIKEDKEKEFEERVKKIAKNHRDEHREYYLARKPISERNYGYFATLVKGYKKEEA